MKSILKDVPFRFAVPLALCVAIAPAFTSPPAGAQVAGDVHEISSFFESHALKIVAFPADEVAILHLARSELVENLGDSDLEAASSAECFEEWDELIEEDRVECLGLMWPLEMGILEWFPDLGTVVIGERHHEFFPARSWFVGGIGDRLMWNTPFGDRPGEITFFDASRVTITVPTDEGDTRIFLAAASADDGSRDDDGSALAGTWTLVQLNDISLRDFPPSTYEFHRDGSFEISMGDGAAGDGAPPMGGQPPEGQWSLSISRVDRAGPPTGEDRSGRLLVLGSSEDRDWDGPQVFRVERLGPDSLVLVGRGIMGAAELHFRR